MEYYLKYYSVKGMKKGVNGYYNPTGILTAEVKNLNNCKIFQNEVIDSTIG